MKELLTVGLSSSRVLLVAAHRPVSPQVVVEASVGVELVLGEGCAGNGKCCRGRRGRVPGVGLVTGGWFVLRDMKRFEC